jgi:uncharacterized protein YhbP (UPF0306 family)
MAKDQEQLFEFLQSHHILTLATTTEDHAPCATPLFYLLHGGIRLYWISSLSSPHSQNLASDREVAAAVFTSTDQWKDIRGAQLRGKVQIVSDAQARQEVLALYAERFHLSAILRAAMYQATLYKFTPSWARYLDNSHHFGYKCEFNLSQPRNEEPPIIRREDRSL